MVVGLSLVSVRQTPMLGSEVYKLKGEEIAAEKTQVVVTLGAWRSRNCGSGSAA